METFILAKLFSSPLFLQLLVFGVSSRPLAAMLHAWAGDEDVHELSCVKGARHP